MVLLGMVPVLTQTPPISCCFSLKATRLPDLAAWIAALCPAGPEPITMTSYFCIPCSHAKTQGLITREKRLRNLLYPEKMIRVLRSGAVLRQMAARCGDCLPPPPVGPDQGENIAHPGRAVLRDSGAIRFPKPFASAFESDIP